MFPKPPPTQPKPKKPLKRTRVKRVRAKARAGRLKGDALIALRESCFVRDGSRCVDCGRVVQLARSYRDSMEMAHIRNKRMHGDNLSNVRTKCSTCHRLEHAYGPSGIKPVPKKELQ